MENKGIDVSRPSAKEKRDQRGKQFEERLLGSLEKSARRHFSKAASAPSAPRTVKNACNDANEIAAKLKAKAALSKDHGSKGTRQTHP